MRSGLLKRLLVVDTETTGSNVFQNGLLSYAFVPFLGGESLEGFVEDNSGGAWSPVAEAYFKGTKDRWQALRKSPLAAVNEIEAYLRRLDIDEDAILVGHNVAFDRYFLEKLAYQAGKTKINGISHRTIDTHSLLMALCVKGCIPPEALSSEGAFKYFNVLPRIDLRHTALGDAVATRELLERILGSFECADKMTLDFPS